MLNLFSLNRNNANTGAAAANANRPSAALLRVTKGFAFDFLFNLCTYSVHLDLSELGTLPSICQVTYPNKDDLLHFTLTISPDDVKTLTTLRKNNE